MQNDSGCWPRTRRLSLMRREHAGLSLASAASDFARGSRSLPRGFSLRAAATGIRSGDLLAVDQFPDRIEVTLEYAGRARAANRPRPDARLAWSPTLTTGKSRNQAAIKYCAASKSELQGLAALTEIPVRIPNVSNPAIRFRHPNIWT